MDCIKIDGYKAEVESGQIRYYAMKGKQKIPMSAYYADMYDNKHLAIAKTKLIYPEVFNIKEEEHYIPLLTEAVQCQRMKRKTLS